MFEILKNILAAIGAIALVGSIVMLAASFAMSGLWNRREEQARGDRINHTPE